MLELGDLIKRKTRLIARHDGAAVKQPRVLLIRDPELAGIAEIADRRQPDIVQSLDRVFEKVKPILDRRSASEPPIREFELPASLMAKVASMPDAEQKIRTIVEFKLSARKQANDH